MAEKNLSWFWFTINLKYVIMKNYDKKNNNLFWFTINLKYVIIYIYLYPNPPCFDLQLI